MFMQIRPTTRVSFNGIAPVYKIAGGVVHPIEKCASDADIVIISKELDKKVLGEGRRGKVFDACDFVIKQFKKVIGNKTADEWQKEVNNLDSLWELCQKKNDPKYLHNSQKGFFGISLKDKFFIFSSKVKGDFPHPMSMPLNKENLTALMEIFERLDKGVDDTMFLHTDLRGRNILITEDDAGLIDFGSMFKLKFPSEKNSKWVDNPKNVEDLTGLQKFSYRIFASDTDYGVSNLKAFEYDLFAPYLTVAKKEEAQRVFDMYLPMKADYFAKRADFFYERFLNDKTDISKQIFCEEATHAKLLSTLPQDVKESEIDKLQLNLFVRDLLYITSYNIQTRTNLSQMSDYIYDVLNKFHEKAMTAMISNDKDSYCYYNNCLVHAQRCAGYFDSILVRNQDKIPCFNTQNKMELLKDKLL